MTAYAIDHGIPGAAGPLNSVGSCAGLLAGLLFGLRTWRTPPGTQLVGVLLLRIGCCAPLLLVPGPWLLTVVLAAAGFVLAPTLVLLNTLTQTLVDRAKLTQAFSWGNSASAAGIALASAFSGPAIDAAGARAGFAVAVGSAVFTAALAVVFRRTLTPAGSPGEGSSASGSATAPR